jgi:vacuolar-type H+-ATPase subunit E/Vma4
VPGTAGPLLDQIRAKAAASTANMVSAARADADALRAQSRERASRQRADAIAAHDRATAAALSRTRADTTARAGRDMLVARAAALDRIFAAAERRTTSLASHPGLRDVLARAVSDGLAYMPEGAAFVVCATSGAAPVAAIVTAHGAERLTVRIDESVPVGVIIEAADRSVIVDATLVKCVTRSRPRLSAEVARRILAGAA